MSQYFHKKLFVHVVILYYWKRHYSPFQSNTKVQKTEQIEKLKRYVMCRYAKLLCRCYSFPPRLFSQKIKMILIVINPFHCSETV